MPSASAGLSDTDSVITGDDPYIMDPYSDSNNSPQPVRIDSNVRFSSIGGLKEHIQCLREMVLFPLMYPELFVKFNTRPAKGVLFHGPPGTGKTLLARALANECSLVGGRKVAFFMRKGADCLKKWVGESEGNLRILFQTASRMKPSIIFFDEIDALAPSRHYRDSDTHASVVATLLAEMDGLCDRGDVIIIGATNRPDALDPAVRRAGRFDRELYFPPPEVDARLDILKIYTRSWQPRPSDQILARIAKATSGYLGSDIKALCSEAVLKAVRRVYPQIYETEFKLLIDAKNVEVTMDDMVAAMSMLSPASARCSPLAARPLPKHCRPLLDAQLTAAFNRLRDVFPPISVAKKMSVATPSVFLVSGPCAETLLAPALLAKLEPCDVKELSIAMLHEIGHKSLEQAVIGTMSQCRRAGGECVLFVRDILSLWRALSRSQGAAVLMQLWKTQALGSRTLLLAASAVSHQHLPEELRDLFPSYKECVYKVREPTPAEVTAFFKPLVSELPLMPPIIECRRPPPPLPRAPPPQSNMTEEEISRRRANEESKMRNLRIILRGICRSLTYDSRFHKFSRPVDVTRMKDYLEKIKRPMDLGTMLSKVEMQQYFCAKEFLDDIDLICANAIECNFDKHTTDKKMRLEVCALRECAYAAVGEEIENGFELECQVIARRRRAANKGGDGVTPPDGLYFADLTLPDTNLPLDLWKNDHDRPGCRKRTMGDPEGREHGRKRSRRQHNDRDETGAVDGERNDKNVVSAPNRDDDDPARDLSPIKILINMADMEDILIKNVEKLCAVGFEALMDLYGDFSKAVSAYSFTHDRLKLPQELRSIVSRYLQFSSTNRDMSK